jgi:hypothetical protein
MDTAHMVIALGDNHWSWQHLANAVIHPITGKEMEYTAIMKDPDYNHFGREDLAMIADAYSKGFGTLRAPTRVSLSNSLTSKKTEISLTAK